MLKYNGWYWFDEMNEEIKNDFHIDAMDSLIYAIIAKLEFSNNQRKDIKKMDFNEIIEIYKRRKEKEYQKEFDKESLKLTEEDEIVKIIKKAEKEINTKFIKEFEEEICLGRIITKETNKKREEIKAEFNKKYVELNVLLEEVQAQIKAIPNDTEEKYYFAIEILKNYEILDEKGKINA